jgi:hypothetical protein
MKTLRVATKKKLRVAYKKKLRVATKKKLRVAYKKKLRVATKKKDTYKKRLYKGGTKPFVSCESEGCVIYPSIIENQQIPKEQRVVKLYNHQTIYENELNKYNILSTIDSSNQYIPKLYGNGITTSTHFLPNQNVNYIDMEYVGSTILHTNLDYKRILHNYVRFIHNILQLQNNEGQLLVHGDLHGGNVCINNDYHIKFIDLTNIIFVSSTQVINLNSNYNYQANSIEKQVIDQFSSIRGTLLNIALNITNNTHLFNIIPQFNTIVNVDKSITYNELLNEFLHIINQFLIEQPTKRRINYDSDDSDYKPKRRINYDDSDDSDSKRRINYDSDDDDDNYKPKQKFNFDADF